MLALIGLVVLCIGAIGATLWLLPDRPTRIDLRRGYDSRRPEPRRADREDSANW